MDTNETIPPALTADEWADRPDYVEAGVYTAPAGWHRAMALANAALPDGDRRKITRRGAAALAGLVDTDVSNGAEGDAERFYVCSWVPAAEMRELRALAAALAALLPPEGT